MNIPNATLIATNGSLPTLINVGVNLIRRIPLRGMFIISILTNILLILYT